MCRNYELIHITMNDEQTKVGTEGPTSGQGAAAGGVDLARDNAQKAEAGGEAAEPVATPTTEEAPKENAEVETPAAPEATEVKDPAQVAEAQKEVDEMVDFVVTEATLAELNSKLPEGATPLVVGGTVKLAKDHPLLTAQA